MKNVIIFGTGVIWERYKNFILEQSKITCFLDNNSAKWGTEINGIKIINPSSLCQYDFDIILTMSKSENDMKNQLLELGVPEEKIWNWRMYAEEELSDKVDCYGYYEEEEIDIIIASTYMDYNGGTIAAVYAAEALQLKGYRVLLCTEGINPKLLNELKDRHAFVIAPILPMLSEKLKSIVKGCRIVMVNVFQMLPTAVEFSKIRPVLWWIHEPLELYETTIKKFPQYNNVDFFKNINIKAVGQIPQKNFNSFFPGRINSTMAYGIPDDYICGEERKHEKIVFAIIGAVVECKAQDIFIQAVNLLSESEINNATFLIVGNCNNSIFANKVKQMAQENPVIIMTGNLSRTEMQKLYTEIDVVVSPSREDSLPIVMTEAMMHRKVCIASDRTGTAEYIIEGKNGFICKAEDPIDLRDKMRYLIQHKEEISITGNEGRKTYEQFFTMDKFAERLQRAIDETSSYAGSLSP